MARALQPHFHVVAPDMRGHGDSDWARGGSYSLTEYVYDLSRLVRATAAQRARQRGSADITARLEAWDDTDRELAGARPDDFALRVDTDRTSPAQAAQAIDAQLQRMNASGLSASRR